MKFLTKWLKRKNNRKAAFSNQPSIEKLEDRSVPATAILAGGTLQVFGTNQPDRIALQLDSVNDRIIVVDGNRIAGTFDSASVSNIYFDGGPGNDCLQVAPQLFQTSIIDGGTGNDRIYAGSGQSLVLGGAGANRLMGGTNQDTIVGEGNHDIISGGTGNNTLTGGPGNNRFFGYANMDVITNFNPTTDNYFFAAQSPPDLSSTLGLQPSPDVTITADEVDIIMRRAAAATPSKDGIIAIVDRQGRILGVRVEENINPAMNPNSPFFDPDLFVFAVDGAVALARTGGLFGNNQAPLTSRTIQYISQTTVTQREVESNPSIIDENSVLRGPGYVAPVGIGNHFPPGISFTPQVDLFGIEQTNRDSTYHPGQDRIKGTADDIYLPYRFNIDQAYIPADFQNTFYAPMDSFGYLSGYNPEAQSRGIATLPGGVPIVKNNVIVGGIGVFYPGATGFATESNSILSSTYNPALPDRTLEAEFSALAAVGGQPGTGLGVGTIDGIPLPPGFAIPTIGNNRIDLVGITLPIFGPPGANGATDLVRYGLSLGTGTDQGSFLANLLPRNGMNNYVEYVGPPNALVPIGVATPRTFDGLFAPEGYLVTPHDGVNYTAEQVNTIIMQSVQQAIQTRSAIRLPLNQNAKMTIAVTDVTGEVLGLFRMPDGTTFSLDVAIGKARNLRYYNDPTQLQAVDQVPGVAAGTAFTNRTIRYLALPRFPEGIDNNPPGPFSQLNDGGTNPLTAQNTGAPLPASAFQSVFGFTSFHPQSNFRQQANIPNQNGVIYFPGSSALYVGGQLIAGFGISGDGVDQDDVVTFAGQAGYNAPDSLRADFAFYQGIRLPYQKFNRQPILPYGS